MPKKLWMHSTLAILVGTRFVFAAAESGPVETFDINLDLPPQERWNQVTEKYKKPALKVYNWIIQNAIPKDKRAEVIAATDLIEEFWPRTLEIRQELKGMAKSLDMPVGLMLFMNIFYEVVAGCTSIVAQQANGTIWHGRNLDFDIPNLQSITVNVRFLKKGKLLYQGTTYAGYIGLITGMKPGAFSLSQDQRDTGGTIWDNLAEWILKGGEAVSFLYRNVLENAPDYKTALKILQETPLIAPGYIVIGGTKRGEGAVISRDRDAPADTWTLDDHDEWFLVQTNDDHWLPPRDDRRNATIQHMEALANPHTLSASTLSAVLNMEPTLNELTTYTTIMSAGEEYFHAVTQRESGSRARPKGTLRMPGAAAH